MIITAVFNVAALLDSSPYSWTRTRTWTHGVRTRTRTWTRALRTRTQTRTHENSSVPNTVSKHVWMNLFED